jgi:hypothetical protein
MIKIYVYILLGLFLFNGTFAQNDKLIQNFKPNTKSDSNLIVISEIEESIKNSDVIKLARFINSKTYFSLMGNINGYYTTNQAFYLLEDFFKVYKVQLFKFNQINSFENNPYATGTLYYENKGRRNKAQVYVSLKRVGENWIISQLSIN